jgi:cyclase
VGLIPGHGPPTTLAEVARFREMLVELRAAVDCSIKAGASEAAAMQEVTHGKRSFDYLIGNRKQS